MIKRDDLYSYFACLNFLVIFSRIGEIYPIFASLHINFICFGATIALFFFAGKYKVIGFWGNTTIKRIALFLALGAVTIPFAVWETNSFNCWRELILINYIVCFLCFASIQNEKQLRRALNALLFAILIILIALHTNPDTTFNGRAFVTYYYDPNDLGMIFAVAVPLVFGQLFITLKKERVFLGAVLLLLISGILKTGSRGGLLAMAIAIILFLTSSVIKIKTRYKFLVTVVIIIYLLSPEAELVMGRWGDVISGEDYNIADTEEGAGGRIGIWKAGSKLFRENMIFGVGVGNSSTAMGMRFGEHGWMAMHNTYLQVALDMGVGGIVALLLILISIWNNCSQVIKEYSRQSLNKKILIMAYSLKVSLLTFIVAASFLSQAYSIIIPFLLILSDRIKFFTKKELNEQEN